MENGYSIAYVAEAPVVHVHDESFKQVFNRYRREAIAHKEIYRDQEMGVTAAIRLTTINIFGDYREALNRRQFRENVIDVPHFRTAQFLGSYRGFAQSGPVTDALKRRFYYPSGQGNAVTVSNAYHIGTEIHYDEPPTS